MTKFNQSKSNFLNGEVSPKFFGRTDSDFYVSSFEEIRNAIVLPQGGVTRRPGTQFISSSFENETKTRLIPYVISETLKFVIVVTDGAIKTLRVSDNSVDTVAAGTNSFNYTDAELDDIRYAQKGNILILTHPDHIPQYIFPASSSSHADNLIINKWTQDDATTKEVVNTAVYKRFPYTDINTNPDIGFTPSATTGACTITVTDSGASNVAYFTSDMVASEHDGLYVVVNEGVVKITSIGGSPTGSTGTGTVIETLTGTSRDTTWQVSQWNNEFGHPRTVAFFEGRAVKGGSEDFSDTLWGSQIGDIFEYDNTDSTTNAQPFSFTIASENIDQIQWLSPGKTLNVGTLNREYLVAGPNASETLGASNVGFNTETTHGSAFIQAVRAENAPIFVTRNTQRLREFVFNEREDNFQSTDLTLLAEHIINRQRDRLTSFSEPKVKELHHQENDNGVVWVVDNNGGLYALTRNRQRGIIAFHNHLLGGNLGGEAPKVESMCVVPNDSNTHDDVYMIVNRDINGQGRRYLEKIGKEFSRNDLTNSSTSIDDKPVYSDSAILVRLGSPGKTFTGLSHLEGQTIDVLADGIYVGSRTVSSGSVTVPNDATEIIAGFNYRTLLKTVPIEAGSAVGSAQGTIKRVDRVAVRFRRTVGAMIGRDESNTEELIFRTAAQNVEDPIPLFNGIKEIRYDQTYEFDIQPVIIQDVPLPFSISNITFEGQTYDG